MSPADLDEATGILETMMTAVSGTLVGATGQAAADLFYAIGDLTANAETLLLQGGIGAAMLNVFDLSFAAGAAIPEMEAVRLALAAEDPNGVPGIVITSAGIRMALAEEVKILAATTFTSRQDIDAAIALINTAFDDAEEYAADNHDPAVYQALITAHAACVRDLATRARPLPQLVTYSFARVMTSHALANRLYGDASRSDELRAENKIIDPTFCPPTGVALSE